MDPQLGRRIAREAPALVAQGDRARVRAVHHPRQSHVEVHVVPTIRRQTTHDLTVPLAALRSAPCGAGLIPRAYTSGAPLSSARSSSLPMSAGSCCPSSSSVTTHSFEVDAMPASVAGCCPKLRESQIGLTNA